MKTLRWVPDDHLSDDLESIIDSVRNQNSGSMAPDLVLAETAQVLWNEPIQKKRMK